MRVACLLVPNLPLRAELRAHPELAGTPLVVASGSEARAEVIALSPEAEAAGIRAGCSIAQARSMCGELRSVKASPALERAARETLLDVALSLSPRAALVPRAAGIFASEGAVFLDASGIRSLFPSEAGFAAALGARAERLGLPGVIAVASSRSVAKLAARQLVLAEQTDQNEAVTCILPPGCETDFLAPLPIDLLDPNDELAQTLTRFGVHAVRDLLRLPRRGLAHRLGPDVLELIARAQGEEVEPPLPQPHVTGLEEAIDLESPIEQLEPLSFLLRGLLSRLDERLAMRGLACASLDLGLDLAGGGHDARRIGMAAPTRDVRVLLRLVCLDLEQQPPRAPIEGVSLLAEGLPPRSDQLDLFRPRGPDPVALDQALAELESLCGAGQVGAPATSDDHRPAPFRLEPFSRGPEGHSDARRLARSTGSAPRAGAQAAPARSQLAVRALRPPVRAEVRLCGDRHPTSLRSAVANGRILHAAGPWRTTGRWWSEEERFALDHYDVQVSDGTILRLCFDWVSRDWQIDAIYD